MNNICYIYIHILYYACTGDLYERAMKGIDLLSNVNKPRNKQSFVLDIVQTDTGPTKTWEQYVVCTHMGG